MFKWGRDRKNRERLQDVNDECTQRDAPLAGFRKGMKDFSHRLAETLGISDHVIEMAAKQHIEIALGDTGYKVSFNSRYIDWENKNLAIAELHPINLPPEGSATREHIEAATQAAAKNGWTYIPRFRQTVILPSQEIQEEVLAYIRLHIDEIKPALADIEASIAAFQTFQNESAAFSEMLHRALIAARIALPVESEGIPIRHITVDEKEYAIYRQNRYTKDGWQTRYELVPANFSSHYGYEGYETAPPEGWKFHPSGTSTIILPPEPIRLAALEAIAQLSPGQAKPPQERGYLPNL